MGDKSFRNFNVSNSDIEEVAVIVPTLGKRLSWLDDCLISAKQIGNPFIVLISPSKIESNSAYTKDVSLSLVKVEGGLVEAFNHAIRHLPSQIKFFTMLCDDDQLIPENFLIAFSMIRNRDDVAAVYGKCEYIDSSGKRFGRNESGSWAKWLMVFGPNFIPAPGALIRLDSAIKLGGFDERLKLAFDLDLFLSLSRNGKLEYVPVVTAKHRWHKESLSSKKDLIWPLSVAASEDLIYQQAFD